MKKDKIASQQRTPIIDYISNYNVLQITIKYGSIFPQYNYYREEFHHFFYRNYELNWHFVKLLIDHRDFLTWKLF